jgi:hydroxymethylglutaryl-CoA reductase
MPSPDRNLPSARARTLRRFLSEGEVSELTGNLQISLFVDQQILRFQVPMKDTMGMAVVQTLDELECEFLTVSSCSNLARMEHLSSKIDWTWLHLP